MADQLKLFFDRKIISRIGDDIRRVHRSFHSKGFVRASLRGLDRLELLDRAWHITSALHAHLPQPFERSVPILTASLGPADENTESFGMAPFRYLPYVFFVAQHGISDFERAMKFQHALTQRMSCEFSIRAFLERYPEQAYQRILEWAEDPSVHVRRLASEGTRPRLPWAPRLRAFQKNPAPVIALLEQLKDDPELYVRRSVANNLNDIGKDHPKVLLDVCRRWSRGASAERRWLIHHALRSLVKAGDPGALAIIGFASAPKVRIEKVSFQPKRLSVGDRMRFSVELVSAAPRPQDLLVDFAVHFVKANGSTTPKVFKLKKLTLEGRDRALLEARVSFANMTTRKHHAGAHAIDLLVNGVRFPIGGVQLTRSDKT